MSKEPLLYQHVTLKLFEEHLKEHTKQQSDTEAIFDDDISLTYEEENAVHYMGGYVIRKLQNKGTEVDFLILDKPAVSKMESSDWMNLIDRGGLVHITDDCFQLFFSMECAIRRNLNKFSSNHMYKK